MTVSAMETASECLCLSLESVQFSESFISVHVVPKVPNEMAKTKRFFKVAKTSFRTFRMAATAATKTWRGSSLVSKTDKVVHCSRLGIESIHW